MPDDKPVERQQPAAENPALQRFLKETQVNDRQDFIDQRKLFIDSKECMRCHPRRDDYKLPDLRLDGMGRSNDLADIFSRRDIAEYFKDLQEDPRSREARAAERFRSGDGIDRGMQVASRLPENLKVNFSDKSATLETDFVKLANVVPGVEMDKTTSDVLASIKSAGVADDTATVKFNKEASIPIGEDVALIGRINDIKLGTSGELKFRTNVDAAAGRISLTNIEGMKLSIEGGKEIAIRGISARTTGDSTMMTVTIDNPAERGKYVPEALWLKTITVPLPMEKATGVDKAALQNVVLALADAKQVLADRDVSRVMGTTGDAGVDGLIKQLASGLTSVEKNGESVVIRRNNGVAKLDLGGPDIKLGSEVKFKLNSDGGSMRVSDISGINITLPLPPELGNRITTPLREISMGSKDYAGNRDLRIETGRLLEVVRVKVDSNLEPVKDRDGNWNVRLTIPNLAAKDLSEKYTFNLRLDRNNNINMKASEVADIVAGATWDAADFSLHGAANVITSGTVKVGSVLLDLFGY